MTASVTNALALIADMLGRLWMSAAARFLRSTLGEVRAILVGNTQTTDWWVVMIGGGITAFVPASLLDAVIIACSSRICTFLIFAGQSVTIDPCSVPHHTHAPHDDRGQFRCLRHPAAEACLAVASTPSKGSGSIETRVRTLPRAFAARVRAPRAGYNFARHAAPRCADLEQLEDARGAPRGFRSPWLSRPRTY